MTEQKAYWYLVTDRKRGTYVEVTAVHPMEQSGHDVSSCSRRYDSHEALVKEEGLQPSCAICGQPYGTNWTKDIKTQMLQNNWCFDCLFWQQKIRAFGTPDGSSCPPYMCIIEGAHYTIAKEPTLEQRRQFNGAGLGFGGREWRIQFNDGREVTTHNLWFGGQIPERFKNQLPNNAQFMKVGQLGS